MSFCVCVCVCVSSVYFNFCFAPTHRLRLESEANRSPLCMFVSGVDGVMNLVRVLPICTAFSPVPIACNKNIAVHQADTLLLFLWLRTLQVLLTVVSASTLDHVCHDLFNKQNVAGVKLRLRELDANVRVFNSTVEHIDKQGDGENVKITQQGNIDLFAEFLLLRRARCLVESVSSLGAMARLTSVNTLTDGKCFAVYRQNCSREIIRKHVSGRLQPISEDT